jgi:hypothetical protein
MPGWDARLFLITYPAGADGSGHSHPVPGLGYVLEGTMVSAFDDDPEEIVVACQGFQDKASFIAWYATEAADGAKVGEQGKCDPAKHVQGTEPGKRVPCAGASTAGKQEGEEGPSDLHSAVDFRPTHVSKTVVAGNVSWR